MTLQVIYLTWRERIFLDLCQSPLGLRALQFSAAIFGDIYLLFITAVLAY